MVGVGGIGWGQFFDVVGDATVGRNESRGAVLLDARDYCKLHIVFHSIAALLADGRVLPIGLVGDDEPGRRLVQEMSAVGMDVSCVRQATKRPTTYSVACQYPDGAGFNLTAVNGACSALTPAQVRRALQSIDLEGQRVVAVALPEVPLPARIALLEQLEGNRTLRVVSLASTEAGSRRFGRLLEHADLLAVNEDEAGALVGEPALRPPALLERVGDRISREFPGLRVVVTVGAEGAYAFENGAWDHCPAVATDVSNTAGAGDILLAGIVVGLCDGLPLSNHPRSDASFAERQLASALDVGVLAATYKIAARDTIPRGVSRVALSALAERLGVSDPVWPAPARH